MSYGYGRHCKFPASYFLFPLLWMISISLLRNSVFYPFVLLYIPLIWFSLCLSPVFYVHSLPSALISFPLLLYFALLLSLLSSALLRCVSTLSWCFLYVLLFFPLLESDLLSFPQRSARLTSSCLCSDILPYPILLSPAVLSVSLLPYFYSDSNYLCSAPFLSSDLLLAIHLFFSPLSSILSSSWPS